MSKLCSGARANGKCHRRRLELSRSGPTSEKFLYLNKDDVSCTDYATAKNISGDTVDVLVCLLAVNNLVVIT